MFPVQIEISGFKVFTSGLMWFIGCCLAALILLTISKDKNLSYRLLLRMAIAWFIWCGIIKQIGYVHLIYYFINNPEIFKFYEGGMVYYWGFGGGIIGGLLFWRRRPGALGFTQNDFIDVPAHAMGSICCFLHGCCFRLN